MAALEETRPRPTRSQTAGKRRVSIDSNAVHLSEHVRIRRERRLRMGDAVRRQTFPRSPLDDAGHDLASADGAYSAGAKLLHPTTLPCTAASRPRATTPVPIRSAGCASLDRLHKRARTAPPRRSQVPAAKLHHRMALVGLCAALHFGGRELPSARSTASFRNAGGWANDVAGNRREWSSSPSSCKTPSGRWRALAECQVLTLSESVHQPPTKITSPRRALRTVYP